MAVSTTHFVIKLEPTLDPNLEVQRPHILQEEALGLTLQAGLVSVVHGKLSPNGPAASIMLLEFRFIGSQTNKRRFRYANIDVGFAHIHNTIGSELDPVVVNIAPNDRKILSRSTKAPGRFAVFAKGLERAKAEQKTSYMVLDGVKRIEGRYWGEQNMGRWLLAGNGNGREGIPALLRVAIVVKPQNNEAFQAMVSVDVKADLLHEATMAVTRLRGKAGIYPVSFEYEKNREPLNPELLGELDVDNLANVNLGKFEFVGSRIP